MRILATLATGVVAAIHVWIVVLEMVLWTGPVGQSVFGTTPEFAAEAAALAFNQGLYNGFLVAGLLWGLIARKRDVVVFFLLCVAVAGIVGGLTVSTRIILVQTVPAAIALVLTMLAPKAGR
ncbi:MAG: DUF1304 domain-containing protein [Parvularculaceae bacterium]|nr:DUF1304 domain-containing protein [Parvularculaceae bacterium]